MLINLYTVYAYIVCNLYYIKTCAIFDMKKKLSAVSLNMCSFYI